MFSHSPVLIVEDNVFLSIDLSEAIEEMDGRVVGPTNRVAQALELLDSEEVAAAIVDAHLTDLDIFLLTSKLAQLGVPFVIQAEGELPNTIGFLHPNVPVLHKPVLPRVVLDCLLAEMHRNGELKLRAVSQPQLRRSPKLV